MTLYIYIYIYIYVCVCVCYFRVPASVFKLSVTNEFLELEDGWRGLAFFLLPCSAIM